MSDNDETKPMTEKETKSDGIGIIEKIDFLMEMSQMYQSDPLQPNQ